MHGTQLSALDDPMYSPLADDTTYMTRAQIQSKLATAAALQAGRPFTSVLTGFTYHADVLAELVEASKPLPITATWTPEQWQDYRELALRAWGSC